MSGITGALNIARGSLDTSQLAMEVISHNIANANTDGYSEQTLQVQANNPINTAPGQIGTGVTATQVTRQYNAFLNQQVIQKTSDDSYWNAQQSTMDDVDNIFNESSGDGINSMMSTFWNDWSNLATTPDDTSARQTLLSDSGNLISTLQEMDTNLTSLQENLDTTINSDVDDVNTLTKQIATLNSEITSVEVKGQTNANDLRDERDLDLQNLAKYLNISYYEDPNTGAENVYILGGTPLVEGNDSNTLTTQTDSTTGFLNVLWNGSSGNSIDITNKLTGGDIAGSANVRDTQISSYLDSLNTFTKELIWQVNALHSEGTGLQSVSQMTGTVQCSGPSDDLSSSSTFLFGDQYNPGGTFDITVYDSSGNPTNYTIDTAAYGTANGTSGTTVGDLIGAINSQTGGNVTASLDADGHFQMTASTGDTFAVNPSPSGSSSNALAILGVNTFFSWDEKVGQPTTDIIQGAGVNQALTDNPDLISTGYLDSDNQVASGANDVANAISALQDTTISNMGGTGVNTTMDGYYNSLVAQVGIDDQNAQQNVTFNDSLLSEYTTQKQSVTGVNLDDEMTNLLQNQYQYQASSQLITIINDMMQYLFNMSPAS
jgi:flagellar hook-associated protein 1 FlgK